MATATAFDGLVIDGERVAAAEGPNLRDGQPRDRGGVSYGRGGGRRGCRSRGARCGPSLRGLGSQDRDPAREGAVSLGRPARAARRRASAPRNAEHGHGDRRLPLVRRQRRRGDALLRRRRRQVLRLDRARRPRRDRAHVSRADRRRGADHAVELPAQHRELEDRARNRRWQHRRAQAREPVAPDRAPLRRAGARSRAAGRSAQRPPRSRARCRRRPRRAPPRGQGRLYRLDRGGRRDRPQGGGHDQARHARAGREERVHRLRGRRPREGRPDGAVLGLRELRPGLLRQVTTSRRGVGQGRAPRALRGHDPGDRRRRPRAARHAGWPTRLCRPAGDRRGATSPRGSRRVPRSSRAAPARTTRPSPPVSTSVPPSSTTARTR